MNGFGSPLLNNIFRKGIFAEMTEFIICCCSLMNEESKNKKELLPNLENEIRNKLLYAYLRENTIKKKLGYENLKLTFEAESPEDYNPKTLQTTGRVDIKVISEDTLADNSRYYTIECKRLDGKSNLNKAYVEQGVARFVSSNAKYPSPYGENIMLGFMICQVDIKENAEKLNKIQNSVLEKDTVIKEMFIIAEEESHCIYESEYNSSTGEVTLKHLFFDFSSAICSKLS